MLIFFANTITIISEVFCLHICLLHSLNNIFTYILSGSNYGGQTPHYHFLRFNLESVLEIHVHLLTNRVLYY